MNEELKAKWERLWHFFSVSQQFGELGVNFKNASEEERDLIIKTQEIFTKYGVVDHPRIIKNCVQFALRKRKIHLFKRS